MNKKTIDQLIEISKKRQTKIDPSHDFQHILRVTNLAIKIAKNVNADLDIVIPSALFHDTVVYRKDDPRTQNENAESAEMAKTILKKIPTYPIEKIEKVMTCIRECSFSKGTNPSSLESQVLQDADRLESTGAVSIMRTFSSGGQMNREFYIPDDPFCKKTMEGAKSGISLFYRRLLIVEKTIKSPLAKRIAKRRTIFLKKFLSEFKLELKESDIKF